MENDRLINALYRIIEIQEAILMELRMPRTLPLDAKNIPNIMDDLIDNVDVKAILKIADSTLYRIKKNGIINPIRIGKRDYYSREEIKKIANYFLK